MHKRTRLSGNSEKTSHTPVSKSAYVEKHLKCIDIQSNVFLDKKIWSGYS